MNQPSIGRKRSRLRSLACHMGARQPSGARMAGHRVARHDDIETEVQPHGLGDPLLPGDVLAGLPFHLHRQDPSNRSVPRRQDAVAGRIEVHAVDVPSLQLPDGATPAVPGFNLFSHTLTRAVLVPVYEA